MEKYLINPNEVKSKINKDIYGHFSEHLGRCVYEGLYVGENSDIPNVNGMRCDVVNALKDMGLPVLRWPGGCFADEYHWKDGIGPKESRKKMINTHWGGVVEDNSFGTHEFMELCEQIGCDCYINGNVGSGSVQEMSEWVEYMTFDGVSPMAKLREANGRKEPWKIKYFGVGNENWGCGGNMCPDFYAATYKRYRTYVRDYGDKKQEDKIKCIACGPNVNDYNWTKRVLEGIGTRSYAISLHYYTIPTGKWEKKGSATDFDVTEYISTLCKAYDMHWLIKNHLCAMDGVDPWRRTQLIVDEWGTWYDVEPGTNPGFLYQQNTMRDAMVAAMTLNIFNKYSERVVMANIAQLVNVLQSVILTDKEKMLLTPTYHVFKMYKDHQENRLLGSFITTDQIESKNDNNKKFPQLIESASIDENGVIYSTIANTSHSKPSKIKCQIADRKVKSIRAEILTGDIHDKNTFDNTECVKIVEFADFRTLKDGFTATLPACSVVKFIIE